MITELDLLAFAIIVITANLALMGCMAVWLQHKVKVLEIELNTLKDKIEK